MKFTLKALGLAVVATVSTVTLADEGSSLPYGLEFSGSAALTTDYRFRGMTQTESDPAIQAGFQLSHTSGFYAGVWGSNVSFAGDDDTHIELDPYIGYSTTIESLGSKPIIDVGVYYYAYPSSSDLNFVEYYAKLGFDGVLAEGDNITTAVNYTNDYLALDEDAWYFNVGYSVPFGASGFGGVASVGYTTADNFDFGGGNDDYWDWKAGVNYSFASIDGLSAELAAVGTDIDTKGLPHATKRGVETGAVFTIAKSF